MKKIIEVIKVNKFFEKNKEKLFIHNDLDLSIYEGEILSIIGKNGAGKTLLVKEIVGLENIQSGEIKFYGDFDPKRDIGVQFQSEGNSSEQIKVKNLIEFYKRFYRDKVDLNELTHLKHLLDVEKNLESKFNLLSGGERQRVNLLLAIMHNPKILILDEFTTGLDISAIIDILKYIKEIVKRNNTTLIIITHSAKEIKLLTDRVVTLSNGSITNDVRVDEIEKKYKGDFDQFLIDQITK